MCQGRCIFSQFVFQIVPCKLCQVLFVVAFKIEFDASLHMDFILLRTSRPTHLMMYLLVTGSFAHSNAILYLLLLATAFARCFLVGVTSNL